MRMDMHVHTYYSEDAVASPQRIVKAVKREPIDGFAVTDHDRTDGWKEALAAGKKHGVPVIRGQEVHVYHEGRKLGEALVYFMQERIEPGEIGDIIDEVREQDAIISIAHPFDYFRNNFKRIEKFKRMFDAVEAINSRVVLYHFNKKAIRFAKENRMTVTAGSDAHCLYELGNAYAEAKATTLEEFRKALKGGRTDVYGTKTNPLIHLISSATKVRLKSLILQQ